MVKKLKISNPYMALKKNLYSLDIFNKKINGLLNILEKNDELCTLLIERRFINNLGEKIESGYFFIQCLNSNCEEFHLIEFRKLLERIIMDRAKGNYMEVDPILIAPEFDFKVIEFIEQYNKFHKRKPIQIFTYGD